MPDGARILFVCEHQGLLAEPPADDDEDICVMDADGSNVVDLTTTPGTLENRPSWGPAPSDDGEDDDSAGRGRGAHDRHDRRSSRTGTAVGRRAEGR